MTAATKHPLRRILGLGFGLALVFGTTVGVGILRLPSTVAAALGDPTLIMSAWVIGGIFSLMGAVAVAELAAMIPESGGFRVYARRAFGDGVGFGVGHGGRAGPVGGRGRAVTAVLGLASRGLRSTAVRMPRTVHDQGTGGFAGLLTNIARRTGVSGYPGDGAQRWPAVHALDAAVLFRLALEQAEAGTSWHAVAGEGDKVRDIAAVIGRRLGLPVEAVPQETYGPLGPIFATDQPSSSTHTREALGWEPTHPSLLEDLENIEP